MICLSSYSSVQILDVVCFLLMCVAQHAFSSVITRLGAQGRCLNVKLVSISKVLSDIPLGISHRYRLAL